MVGLLGCGCCGGGGGGGGGDPPASCTRCDGIYFGYPADREPFVDDFSTVRPNLQLRGSLEHQGPVAPVAPNAITDYIRGGKLYAFRSPFIVYTDPDPFFGQGLRAIPPKPFPNSASWRQPWALVRRRQDLYFPATPVRKYSFKLNVNYPQNTLPFLGGNTPWAVLKTGVFMRVWFGAPETRAFDQEFFSFTVFAQNLTIGSDSSPNATLAVGISQTNPQRSVKPDRSPTFKAGVTVPWGMVELRLDVTWSPISKSGTREYYVNGVLRFTETFSGWLAPTVPGPNCDSFCNFITDIDTIEPWPGQFNPVIWWRGGVPPLEDFARGNQGFVGSPGPAAYAAVTWSAANNPQDRLWFDDYSFDWSNVSGPTVP